MAILILMHYQVWRSLGLEATSVEICSSDGAATSWTLSLDYCEHTSPSRKMKLHKLALDIPYHDVKPPSGIPVILVEGIRIKMHLGKPFASGSLKLDPCERTCADREGENIDCRGEILISKANEEQLFSDTKAESGADNSLRSCKAYLEQEHNMPAAESSHAYMTPPPFQEMKEQSREEPIMCPVQETVSHLSAETVLSAIETGSRHTMRKLPSRMSRTNIITSNEDFDSLVEIAPALWLPEYHNSVAERAVFLPTISRAIVNVSRNKSASLGLRVKAWQMSNRYPHHGSEASSADSPDQDDSVQQALSVTLWTAMTSALSDTNNVKQSRLFRDLPESGHDIAFEDPEDMLDEIAGNDRSDQASDHDVSDDLLDVGSETDNDSISNWSIEDSGDICGPCCTDIPEHRLPNRWDTGHPSLFDHDFDMFDESTELRANLPGSVVEGKDGGVEGTGGRRDIGICWDGSDRDHDSATLRILQAEGDQSNAEDMLLRHGEGLGATSSSGQVHSAACADAGSISGRERQEHSDSMDGAEHARDEQLEEDLLDVLC